MNESKTIKELLELLYQEIEDDQLRTGLCGIASTLVYNQVISWDEFWGLRLYIAKNRPSRLFSSLDAFKARNTQYFWPKGKVAPRLKWLKKHIKLNS